MLHGRLPLIATAIAVVCLSIPRPVDAQLGGFIKKKVKDTVKGQVSGSTGDASAAGGTRAPTSPSGPQFDERVLELNPGNLDKLQTALVAERAFRDSLNASYARMKTPEQYQQCKMNAMMGPEAQQVTKSIDYNDVQASQAAGQKLLAIVAKQCGADPSGQNKGAELNKAPANAAEAAGLSQEQYAVLKERVKPFCSEGGGTGKVAGSGARIFYVYTESEIAALQPRCEKLMALMPTKAATARKTKG